MSKYLTVPLFQLAKITYRAKVGAILRLFLYSSSSEECPQFKHIENVFSGARVLSGGGRVGQDRGDLHD